jgi:RNA polymerase sigma factor (sigma-70 family)
MRSGQMQKVIQHFRSVLRRRETAGQPDGDLLARYVQDGDEAAFEALVHRHGPMVLGVCRRVLHNLHDAEDAYQATFLVLVRKAATLRSPATLGNWLYGVAHRTALHAREAESTRRAKEEQVQPTEAAAEDPWADLRPLLDQELERLPTKFRTVLILCDLEGRTRKETAALLGVPEGTVASRLAQARALLTNRLSRRGLALAVAALAGGLSPQTAAACVPATLFVTTIQAARALTADQAVGVISAAVLTLTEGVLKTMLLTKLESMTIVLTILGLITAGAGGLAFRALGREQAGDQPASITKSAPVTKDAQNLEMELKQATVKLERLQAEHDALKKRLMQVEEKLKQEPPKKERQGQEKISVFPIPWNEKDGQAMVKLITTMIAPTSWEFQGGTGSIEYFPGTKSLVICNSPEITSTVAAIIEKLEKTALQQKINREDAEQQKNVVRFYAAGDLAGIDSAALVRVIMSILEPGNGGSIEYFAPGKSLVVRHTPQMHGRIEDFLDQLRKIKAEQEKK